MFLGCLFQNRFLIVLRSVLGSILEPLGLPNGVYVGGFGGSDLGSSLGWFLGGGSGTLLKLEVQQNRTQIEEKTGLIWRSIFGASLGKNYPK